MAELLGCLLEDGRLILVSVDCLLVDGREFDDALRLDWVRRDGSLSACLPDVLFSFKAGFNPDASWDPEEEEPEATPFCSD